MMWDRPRPDDEHGHVSSAPGDSGGPLWWQNMKNHKIYQVGVFVANGSNLPWKNQYSAINENYQWIKDTLKANRVKI